MGTGSFPGVKRPGRSVDHPPPSSADVKERVELYLYSPSGLSWPVLGGGEFRPLRRAEMTPGALLDATRKWPPEPFRRV
jgi:hypothetical protein